MFGATLTHAGSSLRSLPARPSQARAARNAVQVRASRARRRTMEAPSLTKSTRRVTLQHDDSAAISPVNSMLLRGQLAFLIFLCALAPPGFCLCRLEAAIRSSEDCDHHDSEEEDHDCDCGQLKPDCILSPQRPADVAQAVDFLAADCTSQPIERPASLLHHRDALFFSSDQPLYLTLRALRI